jgi:hypothetical protein
MTPPSLPRFEASQRREFLKRAAAVAGLALIPGLAACSKDDKDTFSTASGSSTTAASKSSTTTAAAGDTTTSSSGGAASTDALPEGAALDVAFTFTASGGGGGPSRNPYVAVWVESAAGDLVANIGVWYNPPKGDRWINNLATWYTAVASTSSDYLETTTGATQPAGSYTLSWDGTDATGGRAAQGDYVVFVESAQEHGAHSLTSAPITLGTSGATASPPDDGDLSAVAVTYTA